MSRWLLTGGAGYIGAHVLRALQVAGNDVVVYDDLSTGLAQRVPSDVPMICASVLDLPELTRAMRDHQVDGVIHLAAKKSVSESVAHPLRYYRENVGGINTVLLAMAEVGVRHIVYSSSAAVYGEPPWSPIREDTPCAPISPYGETKLIGEWQVRAAAEPLDLYWVALRYFNVAGAVSADLADTSVANLVPLVFAAIDAGERPLVFGTDYPTPDGSCIRDYIHVVDLADAHVAAAEYCLRERAQDVFNVGRGDGASVWEVMAAVSAQVGHDVNAEAAPRRAGDAPELVASVERINAQLGWQASRSLADIVRRSLE